LLVIVGTVPLKELPLTEGFCEFENGKLDLDGLSLPLINGTSVVLAAASTVCTALGLGKPYALIAGDIGNGEGSNKIYRHLQGIGQKFFAKNSKTVVGMSYIKPNILYAKDGINALKRLNATLIADAGAMYVAKASGLATKFDLFTPDLGELAFLSDPEAMHPAYVRNFIFNSTNDVPLLAKQAYMFANAASSLLVKGVVDYVVKDGKVVAEIAEPCIPALEPIGGTGDSLLGIVCGFVAAGFSVEQAAVMAAKVNRLIGAFSSPNPSTKVWEMLAYIPEAVRQTKPN
jgi:NAD(P)H-hydrate repair Nnr-like enzyme with NAD(P)H-hydrate dehydratase domain